MIIFDLDGTLADCEHRRYFVDPRKRLPPTNKEMFDYMKSACRGEGIPQWKPDWKSFYEACDKDTPIEPVCDVFRQMHMKWPEDKVDIQIWSGRCESVRNKTEKWLDQYVSSEFKLKMRPIGDHTPDDQLKERWLDELLGNSEKIDLVFDDRPKVIRMWRRRGIFVFNCCQHDGEF